MAELLFERSYVSELWKLFWPALTMDSARLSLGTGRPLMLKDDESVRGARVLLYVGIFDVTKGSDNFSTGITQWNRRLT